MGKSEWWKTVKSVGIHFREKKKRQRNQSKFNARCVVCQAVFITSRAHASCCSVKCRVARSRMINA